MISGRIASPALRDRRSFLKLILKASTVAQLNQAHAQLILIGLHATDVLAVTKLAQKLSDLHAIRHARKLVSSFPTPDLFLFNVIIRGFLRHCDPFSALSVYFHLRRSTSFEPDNFTYAFAMGALSSSPETERFGFLLHAQSVVGGYGANLFVGSAAVDMYLKFSRVAFARKVFDGIPQPDTVLWNTMISGLVANGYFEDSVQVFRDAVLKGTKVDSTTLSALLPAAAELLDLKLGMKIHGLALKVGFFHYHPHVLTGLILLYSKSGDTPMAEMIFQQIEHRDLVSYNAMISSYSSNNEITSSVRLFNELLHSGGKANSSTMVGLIPLFSPFGHLQYTFCIHSFCIKSGCISDISVSTAFITVYCRLDEVGLSRRLFDEAPMRNLASWNAMICGYTQSASTEMAISLFQEMQADNICPNSVTISSVLSACANLGALTVGKWVHSLIKREGLGSNIFVLTALIDMYSKCGSISEATELFDRMPEKNVVTWNVMILGFGLHGLGENALKLYNEMLHSGVCPDTVSFLTVLYACSHAGLVKEGDDIFHSMLHVHGINPSAEHYACMVDLLGRAGQLDRALDLIERMPIEPGLPVWGAFLGACKIHKNTDLARLASDRLLELDHDNAGYIVLISNIYSVDQNYPKAASVWELVRKRNLKKTPGCTLIEVSGTPHVFTSGDWSHPQAAAIHAMLEKLLGKMKEAGFQTETDTAFQDVEDEEKELIVKLHSEKLAIAFGLIASEPGTEIRIFKNLRVCADCHNATKFISSITQRLIVVRDANRFHHFKDGICSCGDYW